MPASSRISEIAPCRMSSKVFERWLISITDMPTPGSATRSRCASSSTGSGSTAGPAAKLKIRVVVVAGITRTPPTPDSWLRTPVLRDGSREAGAGSRQFYDLHSQDVFVLCDRSQQWLARRSVEIDPGNGRFRAFENDVLGFLDVQGRMPEIFG